MEARNLKTCYSATQAHNQRSKCSVILALQERASKMVGSLRFRDLLSHGGGYVHNAGFTARELKLLETLVDLIDRGLREDLAEYRSFQQRLYQRSGGKFHSL